MPDGPVAFFLPTPEDQELTRVLHDYFRDVGRPDLCRIIRAVIVTADHVLSLAMDHDYPDDDRPVVRFGMGLVAERFAELHGCNGQAAVPIPAGRYDLGELLRRRAEKRSGDG